MSDTRKYLDPKNVASLKSLELKAKLVVEGFITGLHKSPYHGFSVEFSEHRAYRPGDEIRHIDWQVYGRSNKYYVKQFEEETNLRCTLILDSSRSMKFASEGNISKFDYSIYLAGSLAYLMNHQRDAVGMAVFNDEIVDFMPARSKSSYMAQILKRISEIEPSNKTGMASSLDKLAERIKRRGLVVIFSDLFDELDSISNALKHFRHKNHEVILFHILDEKELDFNFSSGSTFLDLETGDKILTQPQQIKKAYTEAVEDYIEKIKEICYKQNVDYHLTITNQDFDKALLGYLAKRQRI
jgi:uncharacterized protein (DUF58 family)